MIETESRGPARWIFIANPKVVNAVGTADLERLREEIVSAAADDAIAFLGLALLTPGHVRDSALVIHECVISFVQVFNEDAQLVVFFTAGHLQMFGELLEGKAGPGFLCKECEEFLLEIGDERLQLMNECQNEKR